VLATIQNDVPKLFGFQRASIFVRVPDRKSLIAIT